VILDVTAKMLRTNGGESTEVPMDDVFEIGVFAAASGGAPSEPLYLRRHRIQSGKQTISITVSKEPASAGIEPYRRLIERIGRDNVVQPITGARHVQ
jgi:ABC-2 type transport system permease protein